MAWSCRDVWDSRNPLENVHLQTSGCPWVLSTRHGKSSSNMSMIDSVKQGLTRSRHGRNKWWFDEVQGFVGMCGLYYWPVFLAGGPLGWVRFYVDWEFGRAGVHGESNGH
jgi:hypothetical protein